MRKDPKGNPLPPRLHYKHGRYWYVFRNRWEPLSPHYPEAMARYGRLVSPSNGMTALVDRVMTALETRGRQKAATLAQYRTAAEKIKPAFAEFEPGEVRQVHISQFHDYLAATHPNMANRTLTVLRIVFDFAVKWGIADHNPAIGVRRSEESKRTRYLQDWEFRAIRSKARPWLALLMDVLYLTGQRVGDVLQIRISDITENGLLFQQAKTGSRLAVEITPPLKEALDAARRLHGNVLSPYLFRPKGKGAPYTYYAARGAYRLAREAAGITDTTLHDIRAKSLTDASREGLDATALAGHASPAMTARYIRLRDTKKVSGPQAIRAKS